VYKTRAFGKAKCTGRVTVKSGNEDIQGVASHMSLVEALATEIKIKQSTSI